MRSPQRLDELCDITMGQAPDGESYNTDGDGLPLIAGAGDFGDAYPATKKFTRTPGNICAAGDIVLGIRATIGEKVVADRVYCLGRGVAGLRAKGNLNTRYLWHWLTHTAPVLAAKSKGATFKQVNREDIQELQISAPPLPEQRRIAAILDKADALRTKRRSALAQLDTLTQSIFLETFGDPATNPKGWPKVVLEELFEIGRGGSPRPIDEYITDSTDGINWIMIGDTVEGGKYITATKKRIRPEGARRSRAVKPGDFLLTNSMSFGRPYIMRTSGCIHDGWLVLSPRRDNIAADYLYSLLSSKAVFAEFARRAPGVTVKNLNIDLVRSVTLPIAPAAKQKEFASVVAAIEGATVPFKDSLVALDTLFASLQHRAFQGLL